MKRTSEEIEATVYNALRIGKKNALSRAMLVSITGANDRQVRAAIEALRHEKGHSDASRWKWVLFAT